MTGATASITANIAPGRDEPLFAGQAGITGSYGGGVPTLTGSASVAGYQADSDRVLASKDSRLP